MRNQQFLIYQLILVSIFFSQIAVNIAKNSNNQDSDNQLSSQAGTTQDEDEVMKVEQESEPSISGTSNPDLTKTNQEYSEPNSDVAIDKSVALNTDTSSSNPLITKEYQETEPNNTADLSNPIVKTENQEIIPNKTADNISNNSIDTNENQDHIANNIVTNESKEIEANKTADPISAIPIIDTNENQNNDVTTAIIQNNDSVTVDPVEVNNDVSNLPDNTLQTQNVSDNSTVSTPQNGISSSLSGIATNKSSNETCSAQQASNDCTAKIFSILQGAQILGNGFQDQNNNNNSINSSQLSIADVNYNINNVQSNSNQENSGSLSVTETINPIIQNTEGNNQDASVNQVVTNEDSSDQNQSVSNNSNTPDNGISSSLSVLATNTTQNETCQALSASNACSLKVQQMLSGSQMFGGFAQIQDSDSQNPSDANSNNIRQNTKTEV